MEDVYYNLSDPGSFGGIQRLEERYKKKKDVIKLLTFQDMYTVHIPVRKLLLIGRVLVHGIDDQWQIDLVDMSSLSRVNNDYKFLLMCIDVRMGGSYEGQIGKIIGRRSSMHIHHFKYNAKHNTGG